MSGFSRVLARMAPVVGVRMIAMALQFVQTFALTRVMGVEVYGLLAVAQTVGVLALLIATFGMDKVLMRRIAGAGLDAVGRDPGWRAMLRVGLGTAGALSIALAALGLAVFALTDLGGVYAVPLIGAAVLAPLTVARQIIEGVIRGTLRTIRSIIASQIVLPLGMMAGAGAMWLGWAAPGALGAAQVLVGATALSALAGAALLMPYIGRMRPGPGSEGARGQGESTRAIMTSGASFALVQAGFVLGPHMDILLLGIIAGPEQAALLRVSARMAEVMLLVRVMAVMHYGPRLAQAHGRGDQVALHRFVREMGIVVAVTGVPIFAGMMVFAPDAMGLMGRDFIIGAPIMQIYLCGVLFTMLAGQGSDILSMCGREGLTARLLWVVLGVNLTLDLLLIPSYGAAGCATANLISMIVLGVGSCWHARRELGVQPSPVLAALGLR